MFAAPPRGSPSTPPGSTLRQDRPVGSLSAVTCSKCVKIVREGTYRAQEAKKVSGVKLHTWKQLFSFLLCDVKGGTESAASVAEHWTRL